MTKIIVLLLAFLVFISGCATKTSEPVPAQIPLTSGIAISDAATVLAEEAYQNENRLLIRYVRENQDIFVSVTLPPAAIDTSVSSPKDETLGRLPVALLEDESPQTWSHAVSGAQALAIAGVAAWQEFRDRLCASITPRKPGTGVVVDFLKQDELYFYYDSQGLLRSVPVHQKPADQRISGTYRFDELLSQATPILADYNTTINGRTVSPALLFNTGDGSEFGYPFLYANQDNGKMVFLRRLPANARFDLDLQTDTKAQTLAHATFSQIGGTLMQPVGSLQRLFSLVTTKTKDTLSYKPLLLLEQQPIPPVAHQAPMDSTEWERELDQLTDSSITQGNLRYLVDGEMFFARLIDSIQSAQESIDIRLYIFDNDDYALKIADLLKRRSKQVRIRVLIDGLGTIAASGAQSESLPESYRPPQSIIRYLESDSDIKVRVLNNPWLAGDHTKTIVIDRRVGFIGGMNIGREYRYDWHDLMVELRGPVVDVLHNEFERSWLQESFLGDLRVTMYRPEAPVNKPQNEDIPIRVLYTKPGNSEILRSQLAAIGRAKQRIYIENAYFTSDAILYELAKARRRGVDVRVIIPYKGDSGIINRSNVVAANAMLANGIRVYIYPGNSHLKGAVYDGWLCLGSANFDDLSLRVNRELNIATSDTETVKRFMDEVLLPDLEKSIELKEPFPQKWSDYLMELIADHL